jgi:glycosyltransferase involved in cell wall biosynthesis
MSFSIVILTFNEEKNLKCCLESIQWCDDIVILDSYSTDDTLKIAQENNLRIYQRKFDNFASQRNFAHDEIKFKHDWVFHLDADEVFTEELKKEIDKKIQESNYDAYLVPSKIMLMGRWLRYSGMYPTYQVRLGKFEKLRFKQVGHGQKEDIPADRVGVLNSPYIHYNFSNGLYAWFERHNQYSSEEAISASQYRNTKHLELNGVFSLNPYQRRNALKQISYGFPFRPFFRFIYMYIFRLGFLDGRQGLHYCSLMALYEFMTAIKIEELKSYPN